MEKQHRTPRTRRIRVNTLGAEYERFQAITGAEFDALEARVAALEGAAPPEPEPPEPSPPDEDIVARGDFENPDPKAWSPWEELQRAGGSTDYAFKRDTSVKRTGTASGRFEVHDGDVYGSGSEGERCELANIGPGNMTSGMTRYFSYAMRFDPDHWPPSSHWMVVTQYHGGSGTGNPPVSIHAPEGKLGMLIRVYGGDSDSQGHNEEFRGDYEIMSASAFNGLLGKWLDIIMKVTFSPNLDGAVKLWYRAPDADDFAVKVDKTGIPTMKRVGGTVKSLHPKIGIYRGPETDTPSVMWHDCYGISKTFEAAKACFSR